MKKFVKSGSCVMIKCKDKRKFFTHKKNLPCLMEFSKIFNAEISVVRVKEAEILDLPQLAPAICDANFTQSVPAECKIIEIKAPFAKAKK